MAEVNELHELALVLKEVYSINPHLTINIAASQIGNCTVQEVEAVLDEYLVTEDGVEHIGPGQGGGWAPSVKPEFTEPEFIGYRWPDLTLQDIPFDINNKDHIAALKVGGPAADEAT
jgi:hypothetical protein